MDTSAKSNSDCIDPIAAGFTAGACGGGLNPVWRGNERYERAYGAGQLARKHYLSERESRLVDPSQVSAAVVHGRHVTVWKVEHQPDARFQISSPADDTGNTTPEVEGRITADGCINWYSVGIQGHLCEPDDAVDLAQAFRMVFYLASRPEPEKDSPQR